MNVKKRILLLFLLAAGVGVGFGFPSLLSRLQDFQIESQSELLDADTIRLTMKSSLNTTERLWLVNYYSSSVVLDSGQNMTDEEAKKQVICELEKFSGPVSDTFQTSECYVEKYDIYLRMAEDESASSLVIWDFWLRDQEGNSAEVILDDETGNVLGISCYSKSDFFENGTEKSDAQLYKDEVLENDLDDVRLMLLEYISDNYTDVQYMESYITGITDQNINYALIFQDSDGRQYEFPVTIAKNAFFFNLQ